MSSLPPSLNFSRLNAQLSFNGDTVRTPTLLLESQGITIRGKGQFIKDGDMDYELQVAISPDVAQKIPLLRDSFNVGGHKLTQNDIELTFHVNGPTFNPSSAVAELPPVGVTLVSGAVEVTSDAIKVIDIPRQILVDLFKIGGGIVGVGKQ